MRTEKIVVLVSACFILMFLFVAALRIFYKYELTNYEYESLMQSKRIVDRMQLYVRPSLDYVPMIYAPLYYYCGALFMLLFGKTFFPLRLLSFAASLGVMYLLFRYLKKDSGSGRAVIVAAGFFAACYQIAGASFEVARVDSLALFFFVCSVYLSRFAKTIKGMIAAVLFFVLACLTKQTYILLILVPLFFIYKNNRSHAIFFVILTAIVLTAVVFPLNIYTQGWFFYYVFYLPSKHRLYENIIGRLFQVIYVYKYFFAILSACLFIMKDKEKSLQSEGIITLIVTIICVFYTLKIGGSNNMMFPAFATLAILFAQTFKKFLINKNILPAIIVIAIFCLFTYSPVEYIDKSQEKAILDRQVKYMATIKGEVFMPSAPLLVTLAGKEPTVRTDPLGDLLGEWGDEKPTKEGLDIIYIINGKLAEKKFSYIRLSGKERSSKMYILLQDQLTKNYKLISPPGSYYYDYIPNAS